MREATPTTPGLPRWRSLWRRLGSTVDQDGLCGEIIAAYQHPSRAYHDLGHLSACLAHLDAQADAAQSADEIERAIWSHDAIYRVRRSDNEEKSAEWARTAILEAGLDAGLAGRVAELVLATRHASLPSDPDARLLVDIDLAISAARPRSSTVTRRRSAASTGGCRSCCTAGSARILESFLARDSIFLTEAFRERYESQARRNPSRSVARLGGRRYRLPRERE